jgi:ELWxxDGT repeat protein
MKEVLTPNRGLARRWRRLAPAFISVSWACAWALALPLPAPAQNQVPYLVSDITPGIDDSIPQFGVGTGEFLSLGDRVLFASTGEVWATDGTPAGTVQLAYSSCHDCYGNGFVATIGPLAFFTLVETTNASLWRTDGTRAGTFKLASLGFAPEHSYPVLDGHLFFAGCVQAGCGLLRSDGTVAGTALIGATGALTPTIVLSGGKLYFFVNPTSAPELWVSDGTPAGTRRVVRFDATQVLVDVTAVAGGVVFVPNRPDTGAQLWASDGTAAGTQPVTHFPSRPGAFTQLSDVKALGGRAWFVADDGAHGLQLWRSDGTAAGTVRMTDLAAPNSLVASEYQQLAEVGGTIVFLAADNAGVEPWAAGDTPGMEHPLCAAECRGFSSPLVQAGMQLYFVVSTGNFPNSSAALWTTDGTAAGTRQVAVMCTAPCEEYAPLTLAPLGDKIYFDLTPQPPAQPQLWVSDGTGAGTRLVSLRAAVLGGLVRLPTVRTDLLPPIGARGAQLLFVADDDRGTLQLWASAGAPGSEQQLTDIVTPRSSNPRAFVAAGGLVFFQLQSLGGLWQSDGTAAGTVPVVGAPPLNLYGHGTGTTVGSMIGAGSLLFFLQAGPQEIELWRADGTAAGTVKLTSFPVGTRLSGLTAAGPGHVVFAVQAPAPAIWQSDGTPQGTGKAFDAPSGTSSPGGLAVLGSQIYFTAIDTQGAHGIWASDGTAAGTMQLTSFPPEKFANPNFDPGFTAVGSRVFFIGPTTRQVLMVTDGTAAGTVPLAPPLGPAAPTSLVAGATRVYLLDGNHQLWRSDGTAAGTVKVSDDCCLLPGLVTLGDRVFFTAAGLLLLTSDGTAEGTGFVVDPHRFSISGQPLVVAVGRMFFTADDGVHGFELWQTDGTAAGTRMVADLKPGPAGSAPAGMTQAGGLLFFAADDGLVGDQLWALPLGSGPACQPIDAWLCLLGGRFRVEAAWRDRRGNSGAGYAVTLTADTGWFWFFGPGNVEVMLKVLDGTALDGHVWVFYGALSDVEYTLTVTDTLTGVRRRYVNPPGQLASVADTHAFGPMGAVWVPHPPSPAAARRPGPPAPGVHPAVAAGPRHGGPGCHTGPRRLCLQQARFTVTVAWQDFQGNQGYGTTLPLTSDTGAFWFFSPDNVELVIKVLDGRPLNGKFWAFYGALSNVDYTLTVTDTETGAVKTYHNPSGNLASVADVSAFSP